MDFYIVIPILILTISAILLFFCIANLAQVQGSRNTNPDYRTAYQKLCESIMPAVTLVLIILLMALFRLFPDYFHFSFYVIPAILSFGLAFGALAISFVSFAPPSSSSSS